MSLKTIYVTRHGFRSSWQVDHRTGVYSASIPSPTGIPADPALTSHGIDQARELAQQLMAVDPPIEAIYSSPYYRCLQTIEAFAQLKLQEHPSRPTGSAKPLIRAEAGLCEWFGSAPFDHPQPAPAAVLRDMFAAYDDGYSSVLSPSRRGETLTQLYERAAAAMRVIIKRCDAEGVRSVVLCSHAAVVIILGRVLTGEIPDSVDVDDFKAFTCGLSVYRRQESSVEEKSSQSVVTHPAGVGGWVCELNSDCSFLSQGEERGWKFTGDESFPGTGSLSQDDAASKL